MPSFYEETCGKTIYFKETGAKQVEINRSSGGLKTCITLRECELHHLDSWLAANVEEGDQVVIHDVDWTLGWWNPKTSHLVGERTADDSRRIYNAQIQRLYPQLYAEHQANKH